MTLKSALQTSQANTSMYMLEAGRQLAACCSTLAGAIQSLLQGPAPLGTERRSVLQQCKTHLQLALCSVDQLLEDQGSCQPGAESADSSSGDAANAAGDESAPAQAHLLGFPDHLLAIIMHQAGKHTRLVCSRLREAYGPPGALLRERQYGFIIEDVVDALPDLIDPQEQLKRAVYKAARQHMPRCHLEAVASLAHRWPGWSQQVTRLELSDIHNPDAAALWQLHALLPGLRELKCAWLHNADTPSTPQDGPPLPTFTALTALTALRSVAVAGYEDLLGTFQLLQAAPRLQRLHANLQQCNLQSDHLQHALEALAQLTHLEVAMRDCEYADAPSYVGLALWAVRGRLRSLEFVTPYAWLGMDMQAALVGMEGLTSLVCRSLQPAGWDRYAFDGIAPLPATLRHLALGSGKDGWGDGAGKMVEETYAMFDDEALEPCGQLEALWLPAMYGREDCEGLSAWLEEVFSHRCPGVTSLQVGYLDEPGPWSMPITLFQHLQRLALALDSTGLEQLYHLGALPALHSLWLHVNYDACNWESPRNRAPPGEMLRHATSLTSLTICVAAYDNVQDAVTRDAMVGWVLGVAGGLPQLRVLDTLGLVQACGADAPWQALVAAPLPALCKLVLRSSTRAGQTAVVPVKESEHEAAVAAVRGGLPKGIRVGSSVGGYLLSELQPCPWSLGVDAAGEWSVQWL